MDGYCIYLDDLSTDLSLEHVIPLSLGGHDDFTIYADRGYNNKVGSIIDGALANDFLTLFDRDRQGAKGHSGRHPEPMVKKATLEDGSPVQVVFSSKGLRIFNARERRYLTAEERSSRVLTCNGIKINLDADIKFVAKVAMSAGYFAYGDHFRKGVRHAEIRLIANAERLDEVRPDVRLFGRFQNPDDLDQRNGDLLRILKLACESSKSSCVLLLPGHGCFGVAVGVLGTFMGMINIPADVTGFPNDGDYDLGHCMYIQNGALKRLSFRKLMQKVEELLEPENDSLMPASDIEPAPLLI